MLALQEPWDWLLPALCAAGQPVLDPRFNFLIDPAASNPLAAPPAPSPAAAAPASASATDTTAAAEHEGSLQGQVTVPHLPVQMLLGLQPLIGRPPFLGPLVAKLTAVQLVLGGLDWSCNSSRTVQQLNTGLRVQAGLWDEQRFTQLFTLLADHPPRDLQPHDVAMLRELPMYRLAQPPAVTQPPAVAQPLEQGQGQPPSSSSAEGGSNGDMPAAAPQLVTLGSSTEWVLAPAAVMQACAGENHG